jgi:hypothetical protein
MSHQDDLESNYKVASNEQPSNEIDQLIIQAASDALESSASQNDQTDVHNKSNVIKGRFNLRQWQTPVSIAAAALFTVSFISTYDLWQINEDDYAQDSLESSLPYKNIPGKPVSEKEIAATPPPVSLSQQTNNKKDQSLQTLAIAKRNSDSDEQMQAIVTGSRIARDNKILTSQPAAEEKTLIASKLESINTANDSQSEPETISVTAEVKAKVNLHDKIVMLDITQWIEKIETDVENDKIENAKAEIAILIKQHPLSTFTEQQRDRFDTINKKIHLARSNEIKQ